MEEQSSKVIRCHFTYNYSPQGGACVKYPSADQVKEFHELLDEADDTNTNEYDEILEWQGEIETYVDEDFYVCPNHIHMITCWDCEELLTRQQIQNYLNSDGDYNHLNEGLCIGPAGCTTCWINHDYEIRCELGIKDYPPLPPSPTELKLESSTTTKRMWENPLTLDDLTNNVDSIPKTRIQEENVRYGMAFCANETKDKSVKKLREYLESHPNPTYVKSETQPTCTIVLDGSTSLSFPYPKGKTQKDLVNYLYDFFN